MDCRLDAAAVLRAALPAPSQRRLGSVVGLEHEFRVLDASGTEVDFRRLITGLGWGVPHLDPGDPNAHRLPSGAVLTCDEAEAEIALAPVSVAAGFGSALAAEADRHRAALAGRLPTGLRLDGYSTHLSIAVPDAAWRDACAFRYAVTFAPALMLLMDRATSPGLLVRPRPRRLELGGEYVAQSALVAAATFALGSVMAAARAAEGDRILPMPALRCTLGAADTRYGWFVDRRAFGPDLYEAGRRTILRLDPRGPGPVGPHRRFTTAQEVLDAGWAVARDELFRAGAASQAAIAATDRVVSGALPLPIEGEIGEPCEDPTADAAMDSSYGQALDVRMRDGYGLAPVMLTWDLAVFLVAATDSDRRAFVSIPGEQLAAFLPGVESGRFDDAFRSCLTDRVPRRRTLSRHDQTVEPGVWAVLGRRSGLLARERRPSVGPPRLVAERAA